MVIARVVCSAVLGPDAEQPDAGSCSLTRHGQAVARGQQRIPGGTKRKRPFDGSNVQRAAVTASLAFVGAEITVISGADFSGLPSMAGNREARRIWEAREPRRDPPVCPQSLLACARLRKPNVPRVEGDRRCAPWAGVLQGGGNPWAFLRCEASRLTSQGWARSPTCDPPVTPGLIMISFKIWFDLVNL